MSKRDALTNDLADSKIEAASIIEFFAIVEAEHLFVKVAVKMKRFDANVGSRNPALEQRPEVLKAIRVYATVHILSGMIYNLMRVISRQSVVGHERIAVERRASSNVLADFFL